MTPRLTPPFWPVGTHKPRPHTFQQPIQPSCSSVSTHTLSPFCPPLHPLLFPQLVFYHKHFTQRSTMSSLWRREAYVCIVLQRFVSNHHRISFSLSVFVWLCPSCYGVGCRREMCCSSEAYIHRITMDIRCWNTLLWLKLYNNDWEELKKHMFHRIVSRNSCEMSERFAALYIFMSLFPTMDTLSASCPYYSIVIHLSFSVSMFTSK